MMYSMPRYRKRKNFIAYIGMQKIQCLKMSILIKALGITC